MNNIGITVLIVSAIFLAFALYIKPTSSKNQHS
jgi:hypothetical protein